MCRVSRSVQDGSSVNWAIRLYKKGNHKRILGCILGCLAGGSFLARTASSGKLTRDFQRRGKSRRCSQQVSTPASLSLPSCHAEGYLKIKTRNVIVNDNNLRTRHRHVQCAAVTGFKVAPKSH